MAEGRCLSTHTSCPHVHLSRHDHTTSLPGSSLKKKSALTCPYTSTFKDPYCVIKHGSGATRSRFQSEFTTESGQVFGVVQQMLDDVRFMLSAVEAVAKAVEILSDPNSTDRRRDCVYHRDADAGADCPDGQYDSPGSSLRTHRGTDFSSACHPNYGWTRRRKNVRITQERSLDKSVNKPVLTQRKVPAVQRCQKKGETPRAEFIDKTLDHVPTRTSEGPTVQSVDTMGDVPVDMQRQVSSTQVEQKTAEVPHVQFFDTMVDVPVVMQTQASIIQAVQQTANFPHADVMEQRQAFIQKVQKSVEVARVILQERVKPAGEGSSVRDSVKQFEKDWRVKHTGTVELPQALPDGSLQDG